MVGAAINGNTTCFLCNHTFDYVGGLGKTEIIQSPAVRADSVVAIRQFSGTEGNTTDLEIIVDCPKCFTKNKTTNSIKSLD